MMILLKNKKLKSESNQRGIALYIAITVTAALILVSFAVVELALKEATISSAGRDSQEAFYAADSGAECATFWDIKNPTNPGRSAFATSTVTGAQQIFCNFDSNNPSNNPFVGGGGVGNATSTYTVTFLPNVYCAIVTVNKGYSGGLQTTKIESKGYNSCASTVLQKVERAIRITY